MNPSRQQFLKSLNRTTFDLRLSMVQLLINNHRREPSWTNSFDFKKELYKMNQWKRKLKGNTNK